MTFPAILPAPRAAWRWLVDIPLRRALAAAPDEPIPFTLTAKIDELGLGALPSPEACLSCGFPSYTGLSTDGLCAYRRADR